jgi:hypothetical protein
MARWRYWLLAWMQRREYPEWEAFGLPADRVQLIDVAVEVSESRDRGGRPAPDAMASRHGGQP